MTHRQLSHHKRQIRRQRIFFFGGIAIIVAIIGIIVGGWVAGEYLPLHTIVIEVFDTKFDTAFYIDAMVILAKLQGTTSMSELSGATVNQITSAELLIQEAGKLGYVVSDEEARQFWQNAGINIEINNAAILFAKAQLVSNKLKDEYFSAQVPQTGVQFHTMAMMVESETVAKSLRERILNGENFTMLADEYAADVASSDIHGDYGWHTIDVFKLNFYSTIPVDYISRADAEAGDVSQPLTDNVSSKKLGYWLIRVNERPDQDTANISAIYLGNEEEALDIRARLEAGEELGPIADNLSQYSTSQQNHGELGLMSVTENITDAFNGYAFNPSSEIGKWSQPLRDDSFYTKGGFWLVKIAEKDENRALTDEDRNALVVKLQADWSSKIWSESSPLFINHLTEDLTQFAIDRVSKQL